jgi:tetratricopeptide (TPR) repeat protein
MDPVTLSTGDLQVLSDLDAKQFGFLVLGEEAANGRKKAVVLKAINYLERVIVRTRERHRARVQQDDNNNAGSRGSNSASNSAASNSAAGDVDPKIYCKVGHLHLLLEDYSKALSAYQKYYRMTSKSSKKLDACFLYGLGFVYFHFNAFLLANKAFHDLLYLYPAFERANEVHLRYIDTSVHIFVRFF